MSAVLLYAHRTNGYESRPLLFLNFLTFATGLLVWALVALHLSHRWLRPVGALVRVIGASCLLFWIAAWSFQILALSGWFGC